MFIEQIIISTKEGNINMNNNDNSKCVISFFKLVNLFQLKIQLINLNMISV